MSAFDKAWQLLKGRLAGNLGGRQPENTFTPMPRPAAETSGVPMIPCEICQQEEFADELDIMGRCRKCSKVAEEAMADYHE